MGFWHFGDLENASYHVSEVGGEGADLGGDVVGGVFGQGLPLVLGFVVVVDEDVFWCVALGDEEGVDGLGYVGGGVSKVFSMGEETEG